VRGEFEPELEAEAPEAGGPIVKIAVLRGADGSQPLACVPAEPEGRTSSKRVPLPTRS